MKLRESAGTHITMDAFVSDPSVFTASALTEMFRVIADSLRMTILQGPEFLEVPVDPAVLQKSLEQGVFADEGGITGFCIINKSHMSLHAWPLQSFFSCDVFSCDDFEPEIPFKIIRSTLGVTHENTDVKRRKKPIPGASND